MIKKGETKKEFIERVDRDTEKFRESMLESWWTRLSCVAREMITMKMDAPELIKEFIDEVKREQKKTKGKARRSSPPLSVVQE